MITTRTFSLGVVFAGLFASNSALALGGACPGLGLIRTECAAFADGCGLQAGSICSPQVEGYISTEGNPAFVCRIKRTINGQDADYIPGLYAACGAPDLYTPDRRSPRPANKCASIIDVDNLALGESLPLVGTQDQLVYFSNRVKGRAEDFLIRIPLEDFPFLPRPDVKLRVTIAGQTVVRSFLLTEVAPGQTWDFVWDGKDQNGIEVLSSAKAKVEYLSTVEIFNGSFSNVVELPTVTFEVVVGGWRAYDVGLGGWNISSHHYYDSLKRWLYQGDGSIRFVEPIRKFKDSTGVIRDADLQAGELENVIVIADATGSEVYVLTLLPDVTLRHAPPERAMF